jgi:ribosome-binding protein aMBF1 (putative translation factor)
MSYEHQDWTQVVLKKKPTKEQLPKVVTAKNDVHTATISSATSKPVWKIEKQIDSTEGKPLNYVSKADADTIIKGRIAAKLTQKQLAQRLNMQEKDIKDIETCKAVENKAIIARIKKSLNC